MDVTLSPEQLLFQKTIREFADREIAPRAAELDEAEQFPAENLAKMAGLGLLGMLIPDEYGGIGATTVDYVIALEEIARACASTAVIMSVHNSLVGYPIFRYGSEEQRRRFLPDLASGAKLGAFALTEPTAGSDAASLQTTAVRQGEWYVLNGSKVFITSGDVAGLIVVFAATDRAKGPDGISSFLVEQGTPGLVAGKKERKLGIRASSTVALQFEDCRVPAANLLGEEGRGYRLALEFLTGGRIGIATQAIGIARAAFEAAARYARDRKQFGRPIAEFEAIRFMLADMAVAIDAARLLTYRAANLRDRDLPCLKEASMAKLAASEAAVEVTRKAVQIHGGYGYIKEFPVERHYRDAKVTEIYEGTSEVHRLIISSQILREV